MKVKLCATAKKSRQNQSKGKTDGADNDYED